MILVLDQMKDDFNSFLKNYALWIAIGLVALIAIVLIIFLLANRSKKARNNKPEPIASKSEWISALGGEENIVSVEAYGSRLVLVLKDQKNMDKEKLKSLGVTNFIEMSEKVTLLLEDKAESVKAELEKKA